MTQPVPAAPPSPRSSPRIASRAARVAYAILSEIGLVLWHTCLWFWCAIASVWSLLKQRRLEARRRAVLRQIGDEIRRTAVPEQLRPLKDECDRRAAEVQTYRDAAGTGTAWWSRSGSRIHLLRAKSARDNALQKLGESAIEIAPPTHHTTSADIEAAVTREQTRRAQLWQPWRALRLRQRAEVIGTIAVLIVAGGILFQRQLTANPQPLSDNDVQPQPELAPEPPAARAKKQHELADAFARDRKAATPGEWVVYAGNPVLQRGELDNWDDFKVGNAVVMADGSRLRMWYRACHFVLHEYGCGVGYATSADGVLWEKSPEPVFTPQDSHERERLDCLAIVRAGNQYWMWYSVRPDHFKGFSYPTIHLATSSDGLTWVAMGTVLRALSEYTGNLEPAVYYDGKLFHMWYTDHPTDEHPAILHLTSTDGKQWQTAGSTPLSTLTIDPGRLSVITDGRGGYRAYFATTGQQRGARVFGVLLSNDGNQWRLADSEPKLSFQDVGSARGFALAPSVFTAADGMWVWYTFRPEDGAEEISVAFLKERSS